CDQFHDLHDCGDGAVAQRLRELNVQIAVELTPHTDGTRPGILARRPAPVQVNLGGGGIGAGAPYLDYVIADSVTLPFGEQPYFVEKIVHVPDCHFPHDATRVIAPDTPGRSAHGLPERGFVFCCFNGSMKLNAHMFDIWMRLLRSCEGSVL